MERDTLTPRPLADAPALSRRAFARTMLGGATVIGFSAAGGRWVHAAGERDVFHKVPRLDGTLLLDDATRTAFAQDFGQIVSERPLAVLRPGSARDISVMLRFARRLGMRIVSRGRAHTSYGQSQHESGIVIDHTALDGIGPVSDQLITVGAGARWRAVLQHTLAAGLMPVVLPDFIGQTVGGTLSVGGIGAMSFRSGAQVDHVTALVVVTGNGRIVECSAERHPELFEMVLAGQGQVGVIVEATIRLVPAPETVRVYDVVAPDLDALLGDIATLLDDERFDQMEAWAIPTGPNAWLYLLQGVAFHGAAGDPDDAALLSGLSSPADQAQTTDMPFFEWANRVPEQPVQPHPWIDLILPMSQIGTFVEDVQRTIAPPSPGNTYGLLLIPMRSSTFTRPLFRTAAEELVVGFDTLRALAPGTDPASAIAFNGALFDRCRELGGTQYPISAVELDAADWARHYGEQWTRLRAAKRRFDGDDVLASGPDVLGRC